jgi:O-antigen ligase
VTEQKEIHIRFLGLKLRTFCHRLVLAVRVNLMTIALGLAVASAAASMASIAVSQSLLALAFLALLAARAPLRLPPFWPAVAFLFLWTLLAVAASESPWTGKDQLRKFYVFLTLATLSSTLTLAWARRLLLALAALGSLSALWSFVEFWRRWQAARRSGVPFYTSYIADRITGFKSHWMTFSGEMMIAFLIVLALLLFTREHRRALWAAAALAIAAALGLSLVRSNWTGAAAGAVFLLWTWRRWTVALLPLALAAAAVLSPDLVGQRVSSFWKPDQRLDSNLHRQALLETGLRIAAAHPLLGVGPEHVGRNFEKFVPERYKPIPAHWYYAHLHNVYLQYAAERGLPALLALLALCGWALRDFFRALGRLRPSERTRLFVLRACTAGILALMVGGLGEYNLGDSEVLSLFLTLLCCGYAAVNEEEPDVHPA